MAKLMIADFGDLEEHISLIRPTIFQLAIPSLGPYLVNFPVHILGSQREYEGTGRHRAIRGVHAAKFRGHPGLRPKSKEALVLIHDFDIIERRGRLVRTPWVEKWITDRYATLTKDDDCRDF
jgi:hypothetical protein